jgi:hypothetical protein
MRINGLAVSSAATPAAAPGPTGALTHTLRAPALRRRPAAGGPRRRRRAAATVRLNALRSRVHPAGGGERPGEAPGRGR